MKKIIIVLFIAFLIGCLTPPEPSLNTPGVGPGDDNIRFCSVDADCVAEQCCHPRSAVNYQFAPDCSNVSCTEECQPNTVDCGQGYFTCTSGQCRTVINAPLP